jgi:hypothetical protein
MSTLKIYDFTDDKIALKSPYHPDAPRRCKDAGGKWDKTEQAWVFDARSRQIVEKLAMDIYGYAPGGSEHLVSIQVAADDLRAEGKDLFFCERIVATRFARDKAVVMPDNVVLVSGSWWASGGSVKNPRVEWKSGTVLEIRDIPRILLDAFSGDYTIVGEAIDHEALRQERERCLARIAEIDELLAVS